jgi:hypothetical protein
MFGDACMFGNARMSGNADVFWASHVGRGMGNVTAFRMEDGTVGITRGCFMGSLNEFIKAIKETHGGSDVGKEYMTLVEFIKLRAKRFTKV